MMLLEGLAQELAYFFKYHCKSSSRKTTWIYIFCKEEEDSHLCMLHAKWFQWYPAVCDPVDGSLPGSSVGASRQ